MDIGLGSVDILSAFETILLNKSQEPRGFVFHFL